MTDRVVVVAQDSGALRSLNEYVHDALFTIDEIEYNEDAGTVSIPFRRDPHLQPRAVTESEVAWKDGIERWLRIFQVERLDIEDPSGLVDHSCARFTYDEGDRILTLLSNFPGAVRVQVSSLDAQLHEDTLDGQES